MSLINELREKSNKVYDIRQEVIEEIKEYFDEYLDSDRFEKFLRKNIGNEEINNRETYLIIGFWEYHNGCLDTYFSCGVKNGTIRKTNITIHLVFTEEFIYAISKMKFVII